MSFFARLLSLFRRSPVEHSCEHVDASDLIPAQPDWLERAARNAGV